MTAEVHGLFPNSHDPSGLGNWISSYVGYAFAFAVGAVCGALMSDLVDTDQEQ